MRGRPWGLVRRLRHAASRFQDSGPPPEYYDWIECVRTQKSLSVCDSVFSNGTKLRFVQEDEMNGTAMNGSLALNNNSMPLESNEQNKEREDVREFYKIVVPVLLTACILSFLFNLLIVISVRWVRKALSPTLYLSLSLSIADAYASLVIGIGLIINSFLPIVYGVSLGPFHACFALVLEAFRLGGVVVAVLHLLALAINHYVGILRPLHYAATVTKGTVLWVIAAMWLIPVIFFLSYFSLVPDDGFQSPYCSNYEFLLRSTFRATVSVLFFLPLVMMSVMYMHMFVVVKRHQRGVLQLPSSRQLHKSVKAVITTLLILGTYLLGWMPAVLYYILTCLDCPLPFTQIQLWVRLPIGIFANSMIVIKSIVDPIIYVVRMPEIKNAMRNLYRTRCGLVADDTIDPQSKSEMNRLTLMASRRNKEKNTPNGCVGGDI